MQVSLMSAPLVLVGPYVKPITAARMPHSTNPLNTLKSTVMRQMRGLPY